MSCQNILENVDVFGIVCKLEFEKKGRFKTAFGGLLTVLIVMMTLSLTINEARLLYDHSLPRINSLMLYKKYAPKMDIDEMDLRFGMGFYDTHGKQFDDPSYFTFTANQYILDKRTNHKGVRIDVPIELEYCEKFPNRFVTSNYNYTLDAKMSQMNKFFCFKNQAGSSEGSFSLDYFENMQINMVKCVNSTSNIPCKSKEEIDKKLTGGYFEFYYSNVYLNENNFTNPLIYHFEVYFTKLDSNSYKFVDVYFKTVNLTTDLGYIYENEKTETFVNFEYSKESAIIGKNDVIIDFHINSSKSLQVMNRKYMKFTEMISTIGGILNVCIIIGAVVTRFFSIIQMKIKMLNTLFYFDVSATGILNNNDPNDKMSIQNLNREAILISKIKKTIESNKKYTMSSPVPPDKYLIINDKSKFYITLILIY